MACSAPAPAPGWVLSIRASRLRVLACVLSRGVPSTTSAAYGRAMSTHSSNRRRWNASPVQTLAGAQAERPAPETTPTRVGSLRDFPSGPRAGPLATDVPGDVMRRRRAAGPRPCRQGRRPPLPSCPPGVRGGHRRGGHHVLRGRRPPAILSCRPASATCHRQPGAHARTARTPRPPGSCRSEPMMMSAGQEPTSADCGGGATSSASPAASATLRGNRMEVSTHPQPTSPRSGVSVTGYAAEAMSWSRPRIVRSPLGPGESASAARERRPESSERS